MDICGGFLIQHISNSFFPFWGTPFCTPMKMETLIENGTAVATVGFHDGSISSPGHSYLLPKDDFCNDNNRIQSVIRFILGIGLRWDQYVYIYILQVYYLLHIHNITSVYIYI